MKSERSYPIYKVNKKAEASLVGGHPWVYENDILEFPETEPENGTLADVVSPKGAYLGTGFVSLKSKIRVRLISRNANDTFDASFWRRRVEYAWAYRKTVLEPADLSACRVIFGEADQFPGLTVDRFNNILVTQTLSVGMEKLKPVLFPLLAEVLRADGQTIDGIYERNDEALRAKEGLEQSKGWFELPGESHPASTQTEICENGVYYHVDFENGQKTGFFLDQKYNRRAVARLVTQTLSVGMEKLKPVLFPLLAEVLRADGQTIDGIYERNDEALRAKEGLEQSKGWFELPGESHPASTQTEICENGVYYHVDFENGQKTGFFLDQKYNRRAVARLAAGHTVLDCFTHTGSFALNAASGGAARVTAADISADAIAMAQRNAERNGLTNMDFLCEDTFELLPRLEKEGHPYDFIILDPPAFTKARRTVENAMRGYKEINYRAMKLLPRGGYLATASCSHFATEELFIRMLRSAAKDAHRQLRQIEVRQQAPDHPILWGVPETNYLKFFLFQVI